MLLPEGAKILAISLPEHSISRNNNVWAVTPDTGISADQIVQTVSAWRRVEAISIRKYEGGESTSVIKIDLEGQPPLEFVIVSPPPQLVLARPDLGLQYHIGGYDTGQLFLQPVTNH